jgi:hypothetical protein
MIADVPINEMGRQQEIEAATKAKEGTQPFDNPANLKAKPQDAALVGEGGRVMTFEDLKKDPKAAAKLARLDAGARGVASTWKAQAKAGNKTEIYGMDPVTGELSSEFFGQKVGQAGAVVHHRPQTRLHHSRHRAVS